MKPYRADNVGSMLRPDYLREARKQRKAGELTQVEFKRIEDRAVDEAIAIQESAGLDVISDGELRRNVFASQLVQSAEGFDRVDTNFVDWFQLDGTKITERVTVGLVGKIKRKRHLSAEEFAYLRGRTKKTIKMTIPSPTMYAYYWVPGVSEAAYPNTSAYMEAVTDILRDEVSELVRLGAEYIQVDAPEFGMVIDPHQQEWFESKGFETKYMLEEGIDMINAVIAGHPQITFGLHVCKGNDRSRFMAQGGYDSIAEVIFGRSKAERLLLEYDDERSGDFEPLRYIPEIATVVLGLLTTKWPLVEDADVLRTRINAATNFIPIERLALSTQCGFASVAPGNDIPYEMQAEKLKLVADLAREVWDD